MQRRHTAMGPLLSMPRGHAAGLAKPCLARLTCCACLHLPAPSPASLQYIGGIDPRNANPGEVTIGYVSPASVVKPDKMRFDWRREGGLWVLWLGGRGFCA